MMLEQIDKLKKEYPRKNDPDYGFLCIYYEGWNDCIEEIKKLSKEMSPELAEKLESDAKTSFERTMAKNKIDKNYKSLSHWGLHEVDETNGQIKIEWIKWFGGGCPVPHDTIVEVEYYNGDKIVLPAGKVNWYVSRNYYFPNEVNFYRLIASSCTDPIVERVCDKYKQRSQAGIAKYGVGLDRGDLTPEQWLRHLQEELMDAVNYIEAYLETQRTNNI